MAQSPRAPRTQETRSKSLRRKPWLPPATLEAPPAPEGYVHRWIRTSTFGQEDTKNMASRIREGFEPVRAEDHPDFEAPTIQDGKHAGVIGVGGLILAKFPIETKVERDRYYRGKTTDQMVAVDNDMMREQDPTMPLLKPDRQSRVTFGPAEQGTEAEI